MLAQVFRGKFQDKRRSQIRTSKVRSDLRSTEEVIIPPGGIGALSFPVENYDGQPLQTLTGDKAPANSEEDQPFVIRLLNSPAIGKC